jgi:hypothetical protein
LSLRGDILGWLLRQLGGIDAADPVARGALYDDLRLQVSLEGAFGAAPAEALAHLESAIARQEMHWLRDTGQNALFLPTPSPRVSELNAPEQAQQARRHRTQWLKFQGKPPGPPPGAAKGPFSDHTYDTFTLSTPAGPLALQVNWMFDPACKLEASCAAIRFRFKTRASSFAHAIGHLEAVLIAGGLALPDALRRLAEQSD